MNPKQFVVYILTNPGHTVLYIGVTNNIFRRLQEHRNASSRTFAGKYHLSCLVYFETIENAYYAISREKQLKAGSRKKKLELIESMNPHWEDLSLKL